MKNVIKLLAPLLLLSACGGGGGGGSDSDFIGAALTSVNVTPKKIDTGDRAMVSSEVGEVHKNGIALKFRFPSGVTYVPGSGKITVKENELSITPLVNTVSESEGNVYLVFYLKQLQFAPAGETYEGQFASVNFQVEGISPIKNGKVEVDADVDDPEIDNAVEFNIASPEFSAEDKSEIEVTG